jgi:RND family efflux transporter MFP subunit
VAAVFVDPGAVVSPGMAIVRLVSANELLLVTEINETDIGQIAIGQPAQVRLTAFGSQTFPGRILRIGAQVDPSNRSVPLEVALDPFNGLLLDGMSGSVTIEVARAENAMLVPRDAVHERPAEGFAVWVHRDGQAVEMPVELGLMNGHQVEVVSGLTEADEVVVLGGEQLREGAPVVVREETP